MGKGITPINITSAAMITQFCIVTIIFLAILILRWGEGYMFFYRERIDPAKFLVILLTFTLITMGIINFSDGYSATWTPLFSGLAFRGISWSKAISLVFICDIILISILVSKTGGSVVSCFSPLYFIIPALAIFLREPLSRILLYVFLLTLSFSLNLFFQREKGAEIGQEKRKTAYWAVAIQSLILTTFIGYITKAQ